MTKMYKDCKQCKDCVYFHLIVPELIGLCEWFNSDHCGHCITPEHPVCKEYKVRK